MLQALARSVTRGSNSWLSNLRLLSSAAGEGGVGSTSIYVGNLPFSTTDKELEEAFKQYGEVVDIRLIINRATGQSRGFGFVQMGSEEAKAAIAALDGANFNGRTLRVNESEDRPQGGDRREGGDRRRDSWRGDGPRQEGLRYEGSRGRSFDPRRRQQQRTYDDDSY